MSAIAGRVLLIPKGAYISSTTYHMLDVVSYNGNSYVAKQTTTGNTPSADNEYWMILASGSAVASISDIGDVLITDLANGQVLKYNATSHKWENGDDTGGLVPHLIIISETGEDVVKAVKGTTEIIATETSTGHYECDVPEFGIWTIHAVLNGDDAQVSLNVDTVKVYTVDDSHFHADINVTFPHSLGATCALSATGQTTQYATSSPYDFTVHEAGTYTLTVSYDGTDYTETITVTATGEEFESLLPVPEDAPTGDINLWLFYADIDNSESTYSSLADILADTTALSALMASEDAVDYMVRNTSWATTITASEDAMTYIGLNNYASNTLIADETWNTAIQNSSYFESVDNAKVPVMTSDNTPSGEAYASSYGTYQSHIYNAYKAFVGLDVSGDGWIPDSTDSFGNAYVGYDFENPVRITKIIGKCATTQPTNAIFTFWGSNDKTNYTKIKDNTSITPSGGTAIITGSTAYRYIKAVLESNATSELQKGAGYRFQFYGRKDV